MKNTALIDDRDLAIEVYMVYFDLQKHLYIYYVQFDLFCQCVLEDNDYGPVAEAEKQLVLFILLHLTL